MINYTDAQQNEINRKTLSPYMISTYLPIASPATGLSFGAGVDTKVSLAVSVIGTPNGFDIFTTPQGTALRFIGSGLGNGDSATFEVDTHASIGSANVASLMTFKAKTRPYTEALFTNAVDVPGFYVKRNQPNNDTGALAIVAPFITLNDGDLLEICINSASGVTGVSILAFSFKAKEI